MLGLPGDARNYQMASIMLKALNVNDVCLLSNNPDKAIQLEKYGIRVSQRAPLVVGVDAENEEYLRTKVNRMGHEIEFGDE